MLLVPLPASSLSDLKQCRCVATAQQPAKSHAHLRSAVQAPALTAAVLLFAYAKLCSMGPPDAGCNFGLSGSPYGHVSHIAQVRTPSTLELYARDEQRAAKHDIGY